MLQPIFVISLFDWNIKPKNNLQIKIQMYKKVHHAI